MLYSTAPADKQLGLAIAVVLSTGFAGGFGGKIACRLLQHHINRLTSVCVMSGAECLSDPGTNYTRQLSLFADNNNVLARLATGIRARTLSIGGHD